MGTMAGGSGKRRSKGPAFLPDERSLGGAHLILSDYKSFFSKSGQHHPYHTRHGGGGGSGRPTLRDAMAAEKRAAQAPPSMAARLSHNRAVRQGKGFDDGVETGDA